MVNPHQQNILEVKALVDTLPMPKRIQVYRWLAEIAGDVWTTRQLNALADELQTVEEHCEKFNSQLSLKGDGK